MKKLICVSDSLSGKTLTLTITPHNGFCVIDKSVRLSTPDSQVTLSDITISSQSSQVLHHKNRHETTILTGPVQVTCTIDKPTALISVVVSALLYDERTDVRPCAELVTLAGVRKKPVVALPMPTPRQAIYKKIVPVHTFSTWMPGPIASAGLILLVIFLSLTCWRSCIRLLQAPHLFLRLLHAVIGLISGICILPLLVWVLLAQYETIVVSFWTPIQNLLHR